MISITINMKNILLFLILLPVFANAQKTSLNKSTYDFWLGKWNAEWVDANGNPGKGTNHIFKVLDGAVLEENFEITEGVQAGFKGKSLSVFNPASGTWHQAWTDNQGGYFNFNGEVMGDRKIFKTEPVKMRGNTLQQRMVFYNIQKDRFTWDWESTKNGGKTWNLLWRINYTRQ